MRHSISISTSTFLFLMVGCGGDPNTNGQPAPGPASTTAPPTPTTPAIGPDAGPPGATTPRTLINVPFLEGVAPENRVTDPAMSIDAGDNWFFTDLANGVSVPHVSKASVAHGPAGQGALFVSVGANPNGVALGAIFKIPAGAYTASVWFGVAADAKTALSVLPVTLTFDQNGANNPRAVEFEIDTSADGTRDLDGIHWARYTASITPEMVAGFGYLYLEDTDTMNDVWVTGAEVLAAAKTKQKMIAQSSPSLSRPLRLEESRWLRAAESARKRPTPMLPGASTTRTRSH